MARAEAQQLVEIAALLRADGFAVPELSAGSTTGETVVIDGGQLTY